MLKFKENIKAISPYIPGKPVKEVERELGIKDSIKLASNENAWGFSPKVKLAMEEAIKDVNIYPDGNTFELRKKLAEFNNVEMDNIVAGNASSEVLQIIMRTVIGKGTNVVSSEYAFAMYKIMAQSSNAEYRAAKSKNYGFDVDAMIEACDENTAVIVIANPNNPTGTHLSLKDMLKVLDFANKNSIMLISDEAYVEYVRAKDYGSLMSYVKKYDNLVVVRTFSKAYGMCGLRLGYAAGNKEIIDLASRVRDPFSANIVSQHAGIAAIGDQEFVQRVVRNTHEALDYLYVALKELGLNYIPSECNFILVEVPGTSLDFFNKLLRHGIIVRPMHGYGLNKHIRLSVGTMEQNKKVVAIIKSLL